MMQAERVCPSCNERVLLSSAAPNCPRCGQAWNGASPPTVEFGEVTMQEQPRTTAVPARDPRRQLIGTQLDIYSIQSFLGEGGMAWVFLAQHNNLLRPCAIKILCPELQERRGDSLELFIAEARAAASVVHPHIVTVHNIGSSAGHHFIELEYVPGQPLQKLVGPQPLDVLSATNYVRQACSALGEAHRAGLVHRDFKPSNIMVRSDGFAKLADFGLAKRLAVADASDTLAGTPYFMAPELFAGQPAGKTSDVYAVGVSLFYLLTATYPFQEDNLAELARLHTESPVPDICQLNPEVPRELAQVVSDCLAKNPANRPADGGVLCDALQTVLRGLRDLNKLAAEALAGLNLTWEIVGHRIEAVIRLPSGRRQRVYIEETPGTWQHTGLIRIYSTCAPVREDYLRRALELNAQIPHGSLAIQDLNGHPHFVMLNVYPRATCDAEEIRSSVQDIAHWADEVERILTGEDKH